MCFTCFPFYSWYRVLVVPLFFPAFLALFLGFPFLSYAKDIETPPSIMREYLNQPEAIGSARLSVMTVDVYDATLFAPKGVWKADQPFAIKITYLINTKGEELAQLAIKAMKKMYNIQREDYKKWQQQMSKIFPDVTADSDILVIQDKNNHAVFYCEGKKIGSIKNKLFSKIFFSIWLGKNTPNPEIRNKLLGRV